MTAALVDWDDLFLSAALEPDRWPVALAELASHCRSSYGQLIGLGGDRGIYFNLVSQFRPDDLQAFVAMGGGSADINFRVAASDAAMRRGQYDHILYEKDYAAVRPLLRSDRYVEWCETVDIPFGCQTNLVVDRIGLVGFALLRGRRDGPTRATDRRIFARAAEAARRAVRLQERIEGDQAHLLAGAFEAMGASAFILDRRGRVQAMTPAAEALVSAGQVRLIDRHPEAAGTPVSLETAVAGLVAEDGWPHVRLCLDGEAKGPVFLEGFRLPARRWSLGNLPCAILLSRPPGRDRAGVAGLLEALYRLTTAEADIAMRLFDGHGRDRIAHDRRVTAETLRGQIKMTLAKTGVDGEAQLMRLLAAIMT
jgi:PAS domain-containing protein